MVGLFGFFMANFVAFDADAVRGLVAERLSLAQEHGGATAVIGHSLLGTALVGVSGDFSQGQAHLDSADALYDPCLALQSAAIENIWPGLHGFSDFSVLPVWRRAPSRPSGC